MKHVQHTRQFLFRLNRRQEDRLELGRREVTAVFQHVLEVLREGFRIGTLGGGVVDYRSLGEEEGTDGTHMVDLVVLAALLQNVLHFTEEPVTLGVELGVNLRMVFEVIKLGKACGHGHRVAA